MDCLDKAAVDTASDSVKFVIKNNLGYTIEQLNVTTGGNGCTVDDVDPAQNIEIEQGDGSYSQDTTSPNGRKIRVTLDCVTNEIIDGRFKTDVKISYTNKETGLDHKATVTITGVAS